MKIDLTGKWLFKATDDEAFLPATVPGCQYLDLMNNGVIDDPFIGVNESKCQWIHDKDYEYTKDFTLSADEMAAENIELTCQQLDTICELFINDKPIGNADNCHTAHVFNVKDFLRKGKNKLRIVFASPKKFVRKKYSEMPTPVNGNGQNGIVHIRKPQCHFGWDWGPVLTPVGISGDIYLEVWSGKKLGVLEARARKTGEGYTIFARADNADYIELFCPDGKMEKKVGSDAEFVIKDPQLWWTYELSGKNEQPLYTVKAVMTAADDEVVTSVGKLGLRTIELNREKDKYGYNFQFILNGVPIFAKGANYIPPDSFITRFDEKKRKDLFDAVRFSNMNFIRVWGGGYYADDKLLDECDKRGILVWHDFMFACQAYPFFVPEFLNNVLNEVEYNVRRISSHPCLALWCGNNEIEAAHFAWATLPKYIVWTEKFFYHILPETLTEFDDVTPYTPGSPIGIAHNQKVDADYVGDTHLWAVWHGLQPMRYYRRRLTRFCSEFGFESLPCFETMKTYASPEEYALSSEVQKSHQKCFGGNDKMLFYIASRFDLSDDIEDIIYLSQVMQQECIADATEHWRRNKGRCNGSLYWQLNDCWQTCSWSGYDYLGGYKALQYKARHFNAPLSVSIEDDKKEIRVFLLNDMTQSKDVEVEYIIFSFDGRSSVSERRPVRIDALKNALVFTVPTDRIDARSQGLAVRLYRGGECVMQKTQLLLPEKKLSLPKAPIEVKTEIACGKLKITLCSPVYQRIVMLENGSKEHFSDNFFDLLPGEVKTVEQVYSEGCDSVRIRSVADLKKTRKIKNPIARMKVFFSIRNVINALYNCRVPKEYVSKD